MESSRSLTNFFGLSPELRNHIYEMVLAPNEDDPDDRAKYKWLEMWQWRRDKPVVVLQSQYAVKDGQDLGHNDRWWRQPPILQVCRQMRAETLPMYFGTTGFVVYADGIIRHLSAANDRTRRFGGNIRFIKHFSVLWKRPYLEPDDLKLVTHQVFSGTECDTKQFDEFTVPRAAIKVKYKREVAKTMSGKESNSRGLLFGGLNVDEWVEV